MRRFLLFCFPVFIACVFTVNAQETGGVDKSQWQCKWCPEDTQGKVEASVDAGVGYVSNDSYKFGDFTGLNEKGAYLLADADVNTRGKAGKYLELHADDLGLDSRYIGVEAGYQGLAQFSASYDQLPKLNTDTARTPYSGEAVQRLPSGWQPAATTIGMTELSNSLRDINLSTERRNFSMGATYFQTKALSYDLMYQRETKQGTKSAGLASGFRSAILAIPVDYETDMAKVSVNYRARRWLVAVNYQFSAFNNKNESIRWDNAFSVPANTPEGQAALEPDNSMQQLSVNGSYKITDTVLLAALLSYGQMRQNQQYLPFSINSNIVSGIPMLPRNSLDGKINTLDANFNVHAGVTNKLDLQFQYNHHEQDNATDRATYDYIITDSSAGAARSNIPYSFRQRELQGEMQFRFSRQHRFSAGTDYEIYDRTYQEVDTTNEYRLWGLYNMSVSKLELRLRVDHADRNGDAYKAVPDVTAENPLMRKYNMADRVRNKGGLSLLYLPLNSLNFGFNASMAKDDYRNSDIGLQDSNEANYSVDFHYVITKALTLSALYSLTNIDSTQAGSAAYSTPDWEAENDDRMDMFDLGLLYKLMADKLSVGFDYTYAKSKGKITVDNTPFPELTTKRHTYKLYGDYSLTQRSYLNVAFWYEKYDEENWAIDGVTVNTINNVLSLGEVSPSYDIGYVTVSYKYVF